METRVMHFREYSEPPPEVLAEYANYQPTLEDKLAIQEWRMECEKATTRQQKEQQVSMTETRHG